MPHHLGPCEHHAGFGVVRVLRLGKNAQKVTDAERAYDILMKTDTGDRDDGRQNERTRSCSRHICNC